MAKKVIKKSGKKQKFSAKKIKRSVKKAVKDARLPEHLHETVIDETVKEIIDYLGSISEVTTAEIRDLVLLRLQVHPSVVKAWIAYELKKLRKKKLNKSQ
ncbi:MAG: ATP cone domain-containing protein [Candidatus Woesearchaeota archaeon]